MTANITWIAPAFGFGDDIEHLGAPETARASLLEIGNTLVGTDELVAIYIPESTEDVYQVSSMRGRIVGAVRMIEMPNGDSVDDYYYNDWDGTRRWPIGWPCEAVYAPSVDESPVFREHIEHLFGDGNFGPYVSRFQRGPFMLEQQARDCLNRDFSEFEQIEWV